MKYRLQDLIDMEQFQNLQDRLNEIYSFPSAIIDNEGNILTATAWQDICTQFHRKNPDCARDCIKSDQYIQYHLQEANPAVSYRCPRGLVDNATPIIIEGIHYGNFFTGQFFLEEPDLEFFKAQARTFGFDEAAYLAAVRKVPIWSQKQLESYLVFIKGLILIISESGLKKMKEIETRQQIEESEERANTILSQMKDGFLVTSIPDGKIVDVNESLCRMLGYTRDELLKMSVADIEANDSPEVIARRIRDTMRTGSASFETRFRRKNGTVLDVDAALTYLPNRELFFAFHRDITERKQAEEKFFAAQRELERSHNALLGVVEDQVAAEEKVRKLNTELEKRVKERTAQLTAANQELEAFSYSVSHDLRAPLRALDGFSAALLEDYQEKLDAQGRHYLARIQEATQRMTQLIEDLLNLSRITRREVNLERIDLSAIAWRVMDELRGQFPERQVEFAVSPGLLVRADPNLIKIALENLLQNALKFTNVRELAHIELGMLDGNGARVYFVRDNGAGFDMAYADKLFVPFQRLHRVQDFAGTGIGLTIVQRIITRHGGRIWPEAAVDRGATFYFTLGEN